MKHLITFALFTFILCGSITSVFANGIEMKEGMWEMKTTMEVPGMPHKMPGPTFTECLTKDNLIPPVNTDAGCQIKDLHIQDNTVTYTMVCTQDGDTTTGQGSFTYDNDKMTGKLSIDHADIKVMTFYTGKWMGKCK